jgi:fucose permease
MACWLWQLAHWYLFPAAHARTFGLFLSGLFVIGIGLALLQTASNPYITILGPIESAQSA